jgi:hypothetical protein
MDEHCLITLPVDQPLAQVYVVDISGLAFKTEEQVLSFCQNAGERIVIFRANFAEKKLYISPQSNMTETPWSVADWNTYFANRAGKLEALYLMLTAE